MEELKKKYYELFESELFDSCVPFWLKNGVGGVYGGVKNCLDRFGKVYSTDKSVWMQGRTAYTFSHLCNQFGKKEEYLSFAKSCIDFENEHCFDKADGRIYVVPRNEDFIKNTLIPAEKAFWNDYILTDTMPAPTGNENEAKTVDGIYKECAAEIDLPVEVSLLCDEYNLASQEEKAAGEKKKLAQEKIKIAILKASPTADAGKQKIIAKAGGAKITWNRQVRKIADTDKLKKAGLFDEYCKESESLVMRITAEKKTESAADVF